MDRKDGKKGLFGGFGRKRDAAQQQQTQAGPAKEKNTNPYTFDPNAQHPQTPGRVPTNASANLQTTRSSWGRTMGGRVEGVSPDTIRSTNYMYKEMKFAIDYSGMQFPGYYAQQTSSVKGYPAILRSLENHGGGNMHLVDELPDKESRYKHVTQDRKQKLFSRKKKTLPEIFPLDISVKDLFDWCLIIDNDAQFHDNMIRDHRNFVLALEATYKKWRKSKIVVPVFVIHANPQVGHLIIHNLSDFADKAGVPASGNGLYDHLYGYLHERKMLFATITTEKQQEDAMKLITDEIIEKPLLQNSANMLRRTKLENPVAFSYWTSFYAEMDEDAQENYGLFQNLNNVARQLEHHKNAGSGYGGQNAVRLLTADMSYKVAPAGKKSFWSAGDDSHRVKHNVDAISSLTIEAEQQKEQGLGALTLPQYHERFVSVDMYGDALDSIKTGSTEAKRLLALKPTWQNTSATSMSEIPAETYRAVQAMYSFHKSNPDSAEDTTMAPGYAAAVPIPQHWVKNEKGQYYVAPSGHAYMQQEAGPHTHIGYHIPSDKLDSTIGHRYPTGVFTPAGQTAGRLFYLPHDRSNIISAPSHEDMMKIAYLKAHPALTPHINNQFKFDATTGKAFHANAVTGEIEHIGYHYTPTNLDAHPYHGIVPSNVPGYGQSYIDRVKQKFPDGVFSKDGVNWHTPPIHGVTVSPETKIPLGYHGPFQALHAQHHPEAYNITPNTSPAASAENFVHYGQTTPYGLASPASRRY